MNRCYGTTIFCDDIRDEINNKKTYVGVYNGELLISGQTPALIPTFALAVTYLEPLDEPVLPISIKVYVPGEGGNEELAVNIELPADRPSRPPEAVADPLAQYRAHLLHFRVSPLLIRSEGHIKVRAYRDSHEIRLGSLRIRLISDSSDHADNAE